MTPPQTFPRSHRLSGKLTFRAIYDTGKKTARFPLIFYSLPNKLEHARMGLSVSRHVGSAPRRNLIKRRLRESFRLMQHDWSRGYDLVIVVRPHAPLALGEYQRLLAGVMKTLCAGS